MKINQQLIDTGYITCKKHPVYDYYIYNYTFKCQIESYWTTETLICRGLILDGQGNIIARPFPKFFNYEEYGEGKKLGKLPPYKSFDIYEKLDGSLGILYKQPNGEYKIATRGSFESDQAIKATEILYKKHKNLLNKINDDYTYLFEVIYPENRIVVNYNFTDIVLLSAVNKKTVIDMPYEKLVALKNYIPIVKKYDSIKDFNKITENIKYDNNEGFVIKFNTGLRIKIKYDEYIRQHKIVTGLSTRGIWEMLKEGQDFDELLKNVPDEFYNWVLSVKEELEDKYEDIENQCLLLFDISNKKCTTRKEYALDFQKNKKLMGILFSMLDNKEYSEVIWKLLKPVSSFQPFKDKENV